jgi:hypothetical protein
MIRRVERLSFCEAEPPRRMKGPEARVVNCEEFEHRSSEHSDFRHRDSRQGRHFLLIFLSSVLSPWPYPLFIGPSYLNLEKFEKRAAANKYEISVVAARPWRGLRGRLRGRLRGGALRYLAEIGIIDGRVGPDGPVGKTVTRRWSAARRARP